MGQLVKTKCSAATQHALFAACLAGDDRRVKRLLVAGVHPDQTDPLTGRSALWAAVAARNIVAVKLLLEFGFPVTSPAVSHASCPLHQCARTPGYLAAQEIAILLVRYGAPLSARDPQGRSALDWAEAAHNADLAEYLVAAGANGGRVEARSLLQLARIAIRRLCAGSAQPNVFSAIDKLSVPSTLKRYLKMELL